MDSSVKNKKNRVMAYNGINNEDKDTNTNFDLHLLHVELHKGFLNKCLSLSITTIGFENIQMTMLYFIIGSLSMLGELTKDLKSRAIDYVLSQIVIENKKVKGFRSSNFTGFSNNTQYIFSDTLNKEDLPHLASTYSALSILSMCDLDPSDITNINAALLSKYNNDIVYDIKSIANEVSACQREDGSFNAQNCKSENDVRFTYCALSILKYIGLSLKETVKEYIDVKKCLEYLNLNRSYEGGYSMIQEGESNGGLTYCSIASYIILEAYVPQIDLLIQWLINRVSDVSGVTGRTNKVPDSCYSFWIFATIVMLKKEKLIDERHIIDFILKCQTVYGGFSKFINTSQKNFPDILHTFYSLATLCLLKY